MGRLREKMTGDLELRGRLPNTRTAYLGCVKRFAAYHGQAPDRLGLAEVEAFLLYLAREKQASAATLAVLLPIRLIDSDGRLLDDEHQTDGSEGDRRLMAIRKKDRRVAECGWASSRRKPEIGGG